MRSFFYFSSMKKLIAPFLLLGVILLAAACGKYEDGPTMSLRSRKARVANIWTYDKVTVNGKDFTIFFDTNYTKYEWEFTKDGIYDLRTTFIFGPDSLIPFNVNGVWDFVEDDEYLRMRYTIPIPNGPPIVITDSMEIKKLENENMVLEFRDDTAIYEYDLVPAN